MSDVADRLRALADASGSAALADTVREANLMPELARGYADALDALAVGQWLSLKSGRCPE